MQLIKTPCHELSLSWQKTKTINEIIKLIIKAVIAIFFKCAQEIPPKIKAITLKTIPQTPTLTEQEKAVIEKIMPNI